MNETFEVRNGAALLRGESVGAGPALVFLHAGVADRRMWRAELARFSDRARVIAYDRRGFGETAHADDRHSAVGDLAAVLDGLGEREAVLVGCSQGGRVALDFALAFPERVRALVLVAPAIGGAPVPGPMGEDVEALLEALDAAETAGDVDRLNALEARVWLDGVHGAEGRVTGPARDLFLDMNGIALRAVPLGTEEPASPAWPRLAEIAAPALVVVGDLDFPHVRERAAHLASVLPQAAPLHVMSGTAHLPNLERPDEFAARLADFLAPIMPPSSPAAQTLQEA